MCLYLGPADRAELETLLNNRNTSRKLVWRAGIVLATADGHGTFEIMRRSGMSKPTVWRWQERYLDEGVPGLKRDKTSIRLDQVCLSTQTRSALTSAFAISRSLRMRTTMASLAGFPASRSAWYFSFRSGLNRIATSAGM